MDLREIHATTMANLPRVFGLRDVILLYSIAIVSLQWLPTAAQIGPASLVLWGLTLLVFFVPSGLVVVMELSSRYDCEGGLYVWVKQGFGDIHGFIGGWSYVIANLVFFPTVLLFIAGTACVAVGDIWPGLKDSHVFNLCFSLAILWLVVGANIIGLRQAKRLTNGCAVVMVLVLVVLIVCAVACALRFGSATTFSGHWWPNLILSTQRSPSSFPL